ncbi:ABC transporter permease [Candidatus Woesearchaeota archaeon]|nr:ABC transporter permease [Candidatus Woesearchaeota archaeon]
MSKVYAFVERQINMTLRHWHWELVWILYQIAMALSVGFIGAGAAAVSGVELDVEELTLFLLIGSLLWGFLNLLLKEMSYSIVWERWEGTIEYTFMAPVSRLTHLIGTSIAALIYGIVRTTLVLIAIAFFFNINLEHANLLGAVIILAIAAVSFIGIGMMVSILPLLTPERGEIMGTIVQAFLLMISGIYYPISVLPVWLQKIALLSPAYYALNGMRDALIKGSSLFELWTFVWPLIILGVILIPLGWYIFNIGEKYSKRKGRLKRSG